MARTKTTAAQRERKLTLLRREMTKAVQETALKRTIVESMIRGESADTIAEREKMSRRSVQNYMQKVVAEYKDNFTADVGFYVELLMARYNKLLEMLFPLAMDREMPAIKFVLEILEQQMVLVGASAADRQRQQTVDAYSQKVDTDIQINVFDRYQELLKQMQDRAALPEVTVNGVEIEVLPEGKTNPQEAEITEEETLRFYKDEEDV